MRYEDPVFKIKRQRGRPQRYDFTPFTNPKTEYVLIENVDMEEYDSIRSTFCRWRRINGIEGRYEYDFLPPKPPNHPKSLIIWRTF
jgi:hypothetical protein